jgi:two-component system sensor histidine kinase ChvG
LKNRVGRRFATKLVLLSVVFLLVPAILYVILENADHAKREFLRRSIAQEGYLTAIALRPLLENFRGTAADRLPRALEELGATGAHLKLLFRPRTSLEPDGFLYVASHPVVPTEYLEAERIQLLRVGLMSALSTSCEGNRAVAHRYTNPAGREEVLTSVTPLNVAAGCWAIMVSHAADAVDASWSRPYWQAPEIRIAAGVYLLLALIVIWMFAVIWRNLRRFERFARRLRRTGMTSASFAALNKIPELTPVVTEVDRLIGSLQNTADRMRDAAEEHAHALKGPLGVISQSVEPLRSLISSENPRYRRSVELIERSVERLDALVTAARQMDMAAAESLVPNIELIELSRFSRAIAAGYSQRLQHREIIVSVENNEDVWCEADVDMLETAVENLFDNAAAFSPAGSEITLSATIDERWGVLSVSDRGPGVPLANLERIFERYYSHRSAQPLSQEAAGGNFGIGLWIVRRNADAMGGSATARNRPGGGLLVEIRLPRGPSV